MEELEIPSYFLCPISLQIMRDPVVLSTGITYNRDEIEQWLYSGTFGRETNNACCPVTNQTLNNFELTPNHTLRRLIQAWCTLNSEVSGIERFPTPKAPVEQAQIAKIIDIGKLPGSEINSLRQLKEIVFKNERNKRCVETTPGVLDFLASTVIKFSASESSESASACEEALLILNTLRFSEDGLIEVGNGNFVDSLTRILQQKMNQQSRSYAVEFFESLFEVIAPNRLMSVNQELFQGILNVISDKISSHTTKAALHVLLELCPWGQNRTKVIEAGAIHVLIDLLIEQCERKLCERALVVLEQLCSCEEGRRELVAHAAGVVVVSKKVLRVSKLASERAVKVLHSVSKYTTTKALLQDMLQFGVVSKLCLVLQVENTVTLKTKEKAKEILRLHCNEWRNSPCLSPLFKVSYPSSQK